MTPLGQVQLLFAVSRPLSWIIAPSIWFSGLVQSGAPIQAGPAILFAVALSFPTCLVTFGANDIYDYDSDAKNPRKDNLWADGTVLSRVNHKFVLFSTRVSTILVILLALPASIRSLQPLIYTVSFLSLIWVYSSPPIRLKERPLWDSLSNGVICWLFWASGYTFGSSATFVASTITSKNGCFVLLYASALHSLAAMVDVSADASAGYRTIATIYGERFAALFSTLGFFSAGFMVEPWSSANIATSAGAASSLALLFVPPIRSTMVRLAFAGSYLGSIIWVLKTVYRIRKGQNVTESW